MCANCKIERGVSSLEAKIDLNGEAYTEIKLSGGEDAPFESFFFKIGKSCGRNPEMDRVVAPTYLLGIFIIINLVQV